MLYLSSMYLSMIDNPHIHTPHGYPASCIANVRICKYKNNYLQRRLQLWLKNVLKVLGKEAIKLGIS